MSLSNHLMRLEYHVNAVKETFLTKTLKNLGFKSVKLHYLAQKLIQLSFSAF
jgi:hypothetical protein